MGIALRRNILLRTFAILVGFCGAAIAPSLCAQTIRVATFNASLNRNDAGDLVADLSNPASNDNRIKQINTDTEIIQRINPDILLINEFDFVDSGGTVNPPNPGAPINLLHNNYFTTAKDTLGVGGTTAISFPHRFVAPSNTGIHSGFDLNNNGAVVSTPGAAGYGDDAFGFGAFPGQFAMGMYSKYPIVAGGVRTFQNFLWKDMPGALLTNASLPNPLTDFYSSAERDVLRLSSKSHWDIPINVNGTVVHVLAAHPTPPVFDGPEDRNGRRNHDEIRFWKDYINGANYIYDDNGQPGGLASGERFVILGDYNADRNDGDSHNFAIRQLLNDPLINDPLPTSAGGPQQSTLQGGANTSHLSNPLYDSADFADTAPGNLRADYVLLSATGLDPQGGGVFWPANTDPLFPLVGTFNNPNFFAGFPSSDHRAVFVDMAVPEPTSVALVAVMSLILAVFFRRYPT